MISRIIVLSAALLLGAALVATASKTESVPPRDILQQFPMAVGEWRGRDEPAYSAEILGVLGVDDYLNRTYRSPAGSVGFYIGFYASQRQGDAIHSPMNCLPGAGWEPVSRTYLNIPVQTSAGVHRTISVNRYLIAKGLDQHVVLYWYQSHGRVIANEYRSKIFMVFDAVHLNRTDAALVRVVSPGIAAGRDPEDRASRLTVDFVKRTFPLLEKYLPS